MYTREAMEQAQSNSASTWSRCHPTPIRQCAKFLDVGKFKYETQKKANLARKSAEDAGDQGDQDASEHR
jgi:translation initiation factor IF-3